MPSRLNPYISFTDNAREAISYYQAVFGGTLSISTFGEYGQAGTPAENLVMHATLETPAGYTIMASDTPPEMMDRTVGNNITMSLSGDDDAELRRYWSGLADGGTVNVPLEPQMWGDTFGQVTDKFGVTWMVNIAGSSAGDSEAPSAEAASA